MHDDPRPSHLPCATGRIRNAREARQVIGSMPRPEQDNMVAANMRKIAADALAAQPAADDLREHLAWALRRIETAGLGQGDHFAAADEALTRAQDQTAQPARAGGDAQYTSVDVLEAHRKGYALGMSQRVRDAICGAIADDLAQFIRAADGDHKLGAGALAEHICTWLSKRAALAAAPQQEAPADFPTRILALLRDVAAGPWEDGNGEPLQDDAEAALRWIASRAAAPQPAAADPANTWGYERQRALMEANRNEAADLWDKGMPMTEQDRRFFEYGFDSGWTRGRAVKSVEQPAASTVPAKSERERQLEAALEHLAQTAFAAKDWQYARDALAGKVAAPAAVERVPLTDEQIEALAKPFILTCGDHWNHCKAIEDNGRIEDFARAIERAHGIGSSKEGGDGA